jgi:hypothetical protein
MSSFKKIFKSIFGGSAPKAPAPPPPPPTAESQSDILARESAETRMRVGTQGRASTMLTGGEGVEEDAPTAKKKLLGA